MDEYAAFLAGARSDKDLEDPDYAARRRQVDEGKRFERVRIVDDPPTDGQRFLMYRARLNTAAGEDVRWLPRRDAARLGLPVVDFWLFDSGTLVTLRFDEDDEILGVTVTAEPADVVVACQVRDAARHYARPYSTCTTQVPSDP